MADDLKNMESSWSYWACLKRKLLRKIQQVDEYLELFETLIDKAKAEGQSSDLPAEEV